MGVFHTQLSEIERADWGTIVKMHEQALEFYKKDRQLLIEGLARSVWGERNG